MSPSTAKGTHPATSMPAIAAHCHGSRLTPLITAAAAKVMTTAGRLREIATRSRVARMRVLLSGVSESWRSQPV